MKKSIIAALALLAATVSYAVPAKRGLWKTIRLADGTEVRAELRGDEFMNFWQDDKGRRYVKNITTDVYELADMDMLKEKASAMRNAAPRKQRTNAQNNAVGNRAYEGEKRGLVILVEFNDMRFREGHDVALYDRILNERGYTTPDGFRGSVSDYFLDQSRGKFNLKFDIAGPVTMPKGYAYYGGNDRNAPNPNSKNVGEMLETALIKVNPTVDFSKYDWDGDGKVDQVFFLYAGRGEASGGDEGTIWPHEWQLLGALGRTMKMDGVVVNTYACSCEMATDTRIDGIGTICHEFSHCLGLPDVYDTYDSVTGNYGMNSWDLMDQGSYNGESYTPSGYSAWERAYAGWLDLIELTEETAVTGMKGLEEGGEAYIIRNDGNNNEYYILENRNQVGWDAEVPGSGLLVVHVDYDEQIWGSNMVNSSQLSHQHFSPIQADNNDSRYYAASDVFPYKDVNSLTNESTPAAILYNKNTDGTYLMSKPVTDITRAADGSISFKFSVLDTSFLLYESFDKCNGKGGNDGVFNSLGANKNVGTGAWEADNSGWTIAKAGGANKCAMFTGAVTTPEIIIDGRASMTFKAAPLTGAANATSLTLSASDGAIIDKTDATMTIGKFTEYTVYIEGKGPVKVTFTPGKTFFLDEVKVKNAMSTGIDGIVGGDCMESDNKKFDGKIYSIDGRYMGKDINVLENGIYIKNGKKFVK